MSNHDPEAKELQPSPTAAGINSPPYPHVYPNYPYVYYKETTNKQWTPWLVPMVAVAEVIFFVIVMFVNSCPDNYGATSLFGQSRHCVASFLGRLSFQPWKENPLLGPSTPT